MTAPRFTLEDYARTEARIAEGDVPVPQILEERGLTEQAWADEAIYWARQMAEDVQRHGADAELPHVYSAAFAATQDGLGQTPQIAPGEYAQLVVEIQRDGGPMVPLARRRMSTAEYIRMSRDMSKKLSTDAGLAAEFARAYEAAHTEQES